VTGEDQETSAHYFKNKIVKEETDSKCRYCKKHEENIGHITSGCPILEKKKYLISHDKFCTHLHYSICKALCIETTNGTHTHTNQCMNRKMFQCCGIMQ
jgi:hypothetical protein